MGKEYLQFLPGFFVAKFDKMEGIDQELMRSTIRTDES
jgi:hypothetical protein